jgi:hypothetical protein
MECPHCHSEFTEAPHVFALGEDQDGIWQVWNARCSVCDRLIVNICAKDGRSYPARPQTSTRPRLSEDVPLDYADDYHAACQVYFYSPESTAALSRRLLQRLLAAKAGSGDGGLVDQIRRSVLGPDMPAYLKQGLQMYSRLAKLDSEENKSLHPEALAGVQPGEADWLLDVLQSMLELYFVQPARLQRKQNSVEEMVAPPAPPASVEPEEEPSSEAEPEVAATAEPAAKPEGKQAAEE